MAGGDISTLWDLVVKPCDTLTQGVVPYYDVDSCKWTTIEVPNLGTYDCDFVEACMANTIDGIDNLLVSLSNTVAGHTILINNLVTVGHSHSNYSLLENIVSSGGGDMFLSNDGTYKGLATAGYYQTVQTGNINVPQRLKLAFSTDFTITDDVVGGRTIISSNCCSGADAGLQAQIDQINLDLNTIETNYVLADTNLQNQITALDSRVAALEAGGVGGGLDCTTVMSCPGILGLQSQISSLIANSGEVKVGGAGATLKYLAINDFDDSGLTTTVKKQMSITSDVAGLKLVNDQLAPGNNMNYKTNSLGVKGWYADAGTEVSVPVVAQISVTHAHNLNKIANVICLDGAGYEIFPSTKLYVDANTVICTFNPAFTGTIYFN